MVPVGRRQRAVLHLADQRPLHRHLDRHRPARLIPAAELQARRHQADSPDGVRQHGRPVGKAGLEPAEVLQRPGPILAAGRKHRPHRPVPLRPLHRLGMEGGAGTGRLLRRLLPVRHRPDPLPAARLRHAWHRAEAVLGTDEAAAADLDTASDWARARAAIPLRRCSWPKPPRSAPTRSGAPSATSLRPRDPTGGGRLAIRLPRCPASLLGPHPPHRSAFALGGRTRPGAQCATPEWATRASRSSPSDIAVPRRLAAVAGRALVGHWSGGRQLRSCAVLVVDRVEPA